MVRFPERIPALLQTLDAVPRGSPEKKQDTQKDHHRDGQQEQDAIIESGDELLAFGRMEQTSAAHGALRRRRLRASPKRPKKQRSRYDASE